MRPEEASKGTGKTFVSLLSSECVCECVLVCVANRSGGDTLNMFELI